MKRKLLICMAMLCGIVAPSCKKNQASTANPKANFGDHFQSFATVAYKDNNVCNFFNRTTGSVAFDEATSVPLSDGRVLWITQDAFHQGSLNPANGQLYCNNTIAYSNSVIIQPSKTDWSSSAPNMSSNGAYLGIGNIMPKQPGTNWTWPGPGMEVGNDVYIQAGEGSGLSGTNQALYKLSKSTGTAWNSVTRLTPPEMSGQTSIGYSVGMVKAADGYVYCYGNAGTNFGYNSNIYLARFHVSNPMSWTFFDGYVWQYTRSSSAIITTGLASNSVGYVNGKYVLVTMTSGWGCDGDRSMYTSFSSSPTGPWSPRKKVYTINETFRGAYARYYTPSIHAESTQNNELLVTYCLNFGACGQQSCSGNDLDPYFYRPKGVRIPFSVIGI